MQERYEIETGKAHPLGATPDDQGVNFSLFSENATSVQLLLFEAHSDVDPFMIVDLDGDDNKTFHFWHVYIKGLKPGVCYAYRVDGPHNIHQGHRFNKKKVLIDPYAKGNIDVVWDRIEACTDNDNLRTCMKSVVIDPDTYDWEGDKCLNIPMKDSIIYEMHVGGFTKSSSSKANNPGTFKGVIEKIPYLKELGVTAVELLPVFEFDSKHPLRITEDGRELKNYWGYSTIGFFSPESSYCIEPESGNHLNEFRDMVKELHKAGIEVILDVVFNHTDEGNHLGPVISFKGIDNKIYYHTVPSDRQYYMDYSGCGNTVNCNYPIVEKFITDVLEFWVKEMHVDGFRFDEGSILTRGEDGAPLKYAPVLWNIELMETFADIKLIAEAWDAGGLYQIGAFPGYRWAEWNGTFRDTIRKFVKGEPGIVGAVATKIAGSADVYQPSGHSPLNSINFITCHDGFTLKDLVSYNEKHNEANGENNMDGVNDNFSWNCGYEGETEDREINNLREIQIKNFITILLLSKGIPMITSGDEVGRTQKGNNNTYCQDNEINWFDWTLLDKNKDNFHFFKNMISFRKNNAVLRSGRFFEGKINERGLADITWHGCKLGSPGWNDNLSKVLSFTMGALEKGASDIHVMMNMDNSGLDFEIPDIKGNRKWYRTVDTSLPSPEDITECGKEKLINSSIYHVNAHSIVILISK